MAGWLPPPKSHQWMTEEIRELLRAIKGRHCAKKRTTVIKLAFARANQLSVKSVFKQPDCCAENIWYLKWKHQPEIKTAFDACYERALEWADDSLIRAETYYRRRRKKSVAQNAARAPKALADVMSDEKQRGADRISAANALLTWADPQEAAKAQPHAPPASGGSQNVNIVMGLSDDELDQLLANLEAAEGDASLGEAEAAGNSDGGNAAQVDDAQPPDAGTGEAV